MTTDLKSPQQQIFDAVFAASLELGYPTYDYLPANEASYPFVFVGEQFDNDIETKGPIYGHVTQTIHVFHNYRRRRELTTMMNNLKTACRKLKRTENFYIACKNISTRTLVDETTRSQPLLHGIIEVEFSFS